VTDRRRSGQALRAEINRPGPETAEADQKPLWTIALPCFACTVALASYLLLTIASRLF
jgi:hypothetical protein